MLDQPPLFRMFLFFLFHEYYFPVYFRCFFMKLLSVWLIEQKPTKFSHSKCVFTFFSIESTFIDSLHYLLCGHVYFRFNFFFASTIAISIACKLIRLHLLNVFRQFFFALSSHPENLTS